jgi:hypothetical protein
MCVIWTAALTCVIWTAALTCVIWTAAVNVGQDVFYLILSGKSRTKVANSDKMKSHICGMRKSTRIAHTGRKK